MNNKATNGNTVGKPMIFKGVKSDGFALYVPAKNDTNSLGEKKVANSDFKIDFSNLSK